VFSQIPSLLRVRRRFYVSVGQGSVSLELRQVALVVNEIVHEGGLESCGDGIPGYLSARSAKGNIPEVRNEGAVLVLSGNTRTQKDRIFPRVRLGRYLHW